jgi:hypothetical protein
MKGNPKVMLAVKVSPELKAYLEQVAEWDDRTPANVGRILLEWAAARLKEAGGSLHLLRNTDFRVEQTEREEPPVARKYELRAVRAIGGR